MPVTVIRKHTTIRERTLGRKLRATDSDMRTAEEMVQAIRDGDDAEFRRALDQGFERWGGVEGTMVALASKLAKAN